MKRLISLVFATLTLSACGSSQASYQLTFDTTETAVQRNLTLAVVQVIERRLDRLGDVLKDQNIDMKETGAVLDITVGKSETIDTLTEELTQPFTLRIMKQVADGQG
jgi:hypothetical protein